MRVAWLLLSALLLNPGGGSSQEGTTAFVGVNVLPLDREKVLEDHTVLIRDGVIQEVAPSYRVSVPEGARIIDGAGLFLAPGLADMHVTLPTSQATTDQVEDFMFLLLANNVTVIRGMDGTSDHLQIKRQITDGTLLGPTVWVGGPPLNGENAPDPSTAIERMTAHRRAGYDFQSISGDLSPTVWDSLSEEAHSRGYTFGGNVPDEVGLRTALSSGISFVDHLDGYLEEVVADEIRSRLDRGEAVPLETQLEAVEGRKMRAIAAHTRSSDSWVVPTLYLWENRYRSPDVDSLLALPEMRWVPSYISDGWILEAGSAEGVPPETGELLIQVRQRILRALTMAGVGVLMGTDSPRMFNVPGFALRHEIRSMAAAGLTPYEILVTGSRNVSDYARNELREPANFGMVVEGNRADLILLRANPLEDLEALWDQEGVMIRGEWIPRVRIDEKLESMAEKLGG